MVNDNKQNKQLPIYNKLIIKHYSLQFIACISKKQKHIKNLKYNNNKDKISY